MTDYNTKVTFSVPTLQRPQIRTTERPEISAQPIDISGIVNGITKHATDKQKAEDAAKYEALLSKYASKFDNVQIALGQGEIDEVEADAIRRGLSEEGRVAGISLEDDIKIRKNYGEAVPGIAKQTMEMRAKEQEKVLEDRRAEARSMYASLKNADNQTIDNLFYISDNINQSAEYHRSVLANPFSSAAAREGAKQALNNSILQEMSLNGQNLINSYRDRVVNTNQIDQNFKQSLIDNLTRNAVARDLDPVMARMSAESIYRNSGIADWETLNKHDREAATQEYENIKKNFEANIKARGMEMLQAGVEDNPTRAILFSLPGEVVTRLDEGFIRDFGQFYMTTKGELQKNGQISKQTLRFNNNREFASLINSTDIMLKSPNATQQQKQIAGVMASSQATNFAETQIDPNNINENDITNLNNISKKIDGPEVRAEIDRAKQSKDPTTRAAAVQQEKQLDEFKANKDAINFKYNGSKMINSLLQDNANRLRVDANGNVGVIGDRTAWQSIGDFFTGDTKDTIEDINKGAANMSPKDRVAMFSKLGVQPLQPGEKFVDNFSLTDIGRYRKATKEEYMNKAEQAVNTVLPNLQGEERDAAIKEIYDLVNPDRFANAIHKQNMSEEDYKKWYHDTNVKGLQKIIQKYGDTSPFTGEETTQTNKVSNKTTLSNAFVEAKPAVEGYNDFIQQSAANHGVDPMYLDTIAAIESKRGKYTHASSAGAKGVMQFMPKTWREEIMPVFGFSEKDINDPQKSIEAGAWYIKQCENYAKAIKPDADVQELAEIQAACYNAGAGRVGKAVERAGGDWERAKEYLTDETKNYIGYVKQFYNATDPYDDRAFVAEDRNREMEEEALMQELQDTIRSEKIASGDASVEEFLEDWLKRFRNRKSTAREYLRAAAIANGRPQ